MEARGVVNGMKGKKTQPELVYQVMTSWALTNSYSETARLVGASVSTVRNIVKKNKDCKEFVKLGEQKKNEFAQRATVIIDGILELLEQQIKAGLEGEANFKLNELTTALGTLYDKRALAKGESTENSVVRIALAEELKEYAG